MPRHGSIREQGTVVNKRVTITDLFPVWLQYMENRNVSDLTEARYINYWNKYYKHTHFVNTPLHLIGIQTVEDFYHRVIKDYNITAKELGNIKPIITGIFKIAMRKRYIVTNPFEYADINLSACRKPIKQEAKDKVFNEEEMVRLFEAFEQEMEAFPADTDCLAFLLSFQLALG